MLSDTEQESRIIGCDLPENKPDQFQDVLHEQYGALWQAARYCGLPAPPSPIDGEWQHGWHPENDNWHPEGIVGFDGLSRHRKTRHWHFVARKDQEEALRAFGYTKTEAIGLPIIYTPVPEIERLPGSLLVMPVHSLATTEHDWNFDEYAGKIQAVARDFSKITVCVSASCFARGYWVDAFRSRGFDVVCGANFHDKDAYTRMAILFSRFEFTTTNGFGSHLAYAQHFGSKVSIDGTWPQYRREDFANAGLNLRCPEFLDHVLDFPMQDRVKRHWPWLVRPPQEGVLDQEWAGLQLGKDRMKSPGELMDLFGWKPADPREPEAHGAGRSASFSLKKALRGMLSKSKPERAASDKVDGDAPQHNEVTHGDYMLHGTVLKNTRISQAEREYRAYHKNNLAAVITNPPEGYFLDLVFSDGVAVAAFRQHHPERRIHYAAPPYHTHHITDNLHRIGIANAHPLAFPHMDPPWGRFRCCGIVDWLAAACHDDEQRGIIAGSSVMRIGLCPRCRDQFFSLLSTLPHLPLLYLEYAETGEPCLMPVMASLADLGFSVNTGLLRFFSVRHVPDYQPNLTCVTALRLGEAQRSHTLSP